MRDPELVAKAEAYRDAMRRTRDAWAAYEPLVSTPIGSPLQGEAEAARQAWKDAERAQTNAARSAAFNLAYEMLGPSWYDEFMAAVPA